jgi:hypothetical protein
MRNKLFEVVKDNMKDLAVPSKNKKEDSGPGKTPILPKGFE